jgi:chitinase
MIYAKMMAIQLGVWDGEEDDVTQTVSLPVFMLVQAVDSMDEIKKLGEEEEQKEAEKKKEFILEMVGIALMFIPFVGEAATALSGVATLARIAAIAGDAAGVGLGIYEFVRDPSSALMDLLGITFGLRGLAMAARDADGFERMAAAARRLRADGSIGRIGGSVKTNDDILQGMIGVCKR